VTVVPFRDQLTINFDTVQYRIKSHAASQCARRAGIARAGEHNPNLRGA
jgi:hypothetical protein